MASGDTPRAALISAFFSAAGAWSVAVAPRLVLRAAVLSRAAVLCRTAALLLALSAWSVSARGHAPCTEDLTVDWTFHAAAPLNLTPAISSEGWVLVGSMDGYVHALTGSGHFEWSYTLDAPPLGLAVGSDGRTHALSQNGVLHLLLPSGTHQWGSHLPPGMLPTGPSAQSRDGVVFVPSALNLYAFSANAGLSWRAFVGSPIVSGPVLDPEGSAWVTTKNRQVLRIRSSRQRSGFTLGGDADARVAYAGREGVQLLVQDASGGSSLVSYDAAGHERWRHAGVVAVSDDGHLIERRGPRGAVWTWIEPSSGRVQQQRSLELAGSAPPARFEGLALVPTNTGKLYVFGPEGDVQWCRIASAPLLQPRVDVPAGRIIVASGDGWIAAVRRRSPAVEEHPRP